MVGWDCKGDGDEYKMGAGLGILIYGFLFGWMVLIDSSFQTLINSLLLFDKEKLDQETPVQSHNSLNEGFSISKPLKAAKYNPQAWWHVSNQSITGLYTESS